MKEKNEKNKFIIIGLDGASYSLIGDWIDNGELPNLRAIKDTGYSSILQSTIPFHSAPAWTSMITGVNPGRHGIFDFFYVKDRDIHTVNSHCRRRSAYWNILDGYGLRSLVINVPCTYPPEPLNGCMITGIMTPSKKSQFTYPDALKNELPDYQLDSWWQALPFMADFKDKKKLLGITKKIIDMRFATLIKLMSENEWDTAFLVVRILDHIQHYLWEDRDVLLEAYKHIDRYVGMIRKDYGYSNLFIVSDHGFRAASKCFYANNFLANNGYLKFTEGVSMRIIILKGILNRMIAFILRIFSKIFNLDRMTQNSAIRKLIDSYVFTPPQIFKTSQAYNSSASSCGIFLNDKSIRNDIVEKLKCIKDPETGREVIKSVYLREDIFDGDCVKDAPDIIFLVNDDYTMSDRLFAVGARFKDIFSADKKLAEVYSTREFGHIGEHARNGIMMAAGPLIKHFTGETDSIYDIVPTLLYGMDLGRIENTDGRIMDIFNKELNMKSFKSQPRKGHGDYRMDEDDEETIKMRLKELGYFG
ncbi:MAG: alkaline phosphatase family protein [Elusimicrobiota bacterium]